jgi:ABC-type cobalamin transport system permease subunit
MKRWESWINRMGVGLAGASGIVYGVMKYFLAGTNPDSRLGHPWQPWILAAHVLAAPVAVFGLGLLWRSHALNRLQLGERESRRSGLTIFRVAPPLVVSGYLIQVLTGDPLKKATGWLHAALGVAFALAFVLHSIGSRLPDDAAESPPKTKRRLP